MARFFTPGGQKNHQAYRHEYAQNLFGHKIMMVVQITPTNMVSGVSLNTKINLKYRTMRELKAFILFKEYTHAQMEIEHNVK